MKISCTKEEFARMVSRCASNRNDTTCFSTISACEKCALNDVCDGAYVDTLTKFIEVDNND